MMTSEGDAYLINHRPTPYQLRWHFLEAAAAAVAAVVVCPTVCFSQMF